MRILAIETATEACSAALLLDDVIIERFKVAPREHGDLILPMVDELLLEADITLSQLDALAFGRGPGSFTGVRMATGVIQGLAFAADLPVAAISTLHALANQVERKPGVERIFAALDARMGEVYCCEYAVVGGQLLEQIADETVISPDKIEPTSAANIVAVGHGWRTYESTLRKSLGCPVQAIYPDALPKASDIAKLAVSRVENKQTVAAEHAMPVYLRDNVAKKKAQQ
ncbi:MAG: tRNA (adenosine(37)-N6)-threonylcarbamoyltransferase complex dimerization subunit type 1 TsaB [Piscirickettsiaceae bacterium]|nr:MAG: tRNA (adenosine(37)-N6)-threonylcarbamoyltransferase complex dimerization subunit type 1 TsaB [Piscirickettsiaceae bacterium]